MRNASYSVGWICDPTVVGRGSAIAASMALVKIEDAMPYS
jgi:hypothetical protein